MSLRTLAAALILLSTVVSGCFGSDDAAPSSTDPSETAAGTATSTSTPNQTEAPSFEPPIADFTVASSDANNTNLTTGVEILFNASASSDPAGGNLSFAWDLGDGNATDGVVANHSFAAAGNFTVTLTVTSDASGLNHSTNQTITVVEGYTTLAPITITGTITGAYYGAGYTTSNSHNFEVPTQQKKMTVQLRFSGTAIDLDFDVLTAKGTEAGSEAAFNEPTGTAFDPHEPDIVVEDEKLLSEVGTWKVIIYPGESVDGDYTVTVTFE